MFPELFPCAWFCPSRHDGSSQRNHTLSRGSGRRLVPHAAKREWFPRLVVFPQLSVSQIQQPSVPDGLFGARTCLTLRAAILSPHSELLHLALARKRLSPHRTCVATRAGRDARSRAHSATFGLMQPNLLWVTTWGHLEGFWTWPSSPAPGFPMLVTGSFPGGPWAWEARESPPALPAFPHFDI